MAKRVVSNVVDFDMHNLFPTKPLLDDLKEKAEGGGEIMPRRDVGTSSPLIVMPAYSGDFLDKLRQPLQGKVIEAGAEENLWDFSGPDDWNKHQETPHPRILIDDFYEFSRPGEGAGGDTLKDYWNRSWDPGEAPQVSEDLLTRLDTNDSPSLELRAAGRVAIAFVDGSVQSGGPDSGVVVASFLMDACPSCGDIHDVFRARTAMKMQELQSKTRIHGSERVNTSGVTVRLKKAEPRMGRWTFDTGAKADRYTTVFQFVPDRKTRNVNELDVRVSCTCPSWVYWGAQYNAYTRDYLFGPIRMMVRVRGENKPANGTPPDRRDPIGNFLVCKHVLACIPVISSYRMGEIPRIVRERLKLPLVPKVDIPKGKDIHIQVPTSLKNFGRQPEIRKAVRDWESWSRNQRQEFILGLTSPGAASYLAYKFPETASPFVAVKLKEFSKKGSPGMKKWAQVLLQNLTAGRLIREDEMPEEEIEPESVKEEQVEKDVVEDPTGKGEGEESTEEPGKEQTSEVPEALKNIANNPDMRRLMRDWDKMPQSLRGEEIGRIDSAPQVAFIAYKFPDTATGLSVARLKEIAANPAAPPEMRRRSRVYIDQLSAGKHREASWMGLILSC